MEIYATGLDGEKSSQNLFGKENFFLEIFEFNHLFVIIWVSKQHASIIDISLINQLFSY